MIYNATGGVIISGCSILGFLKNFITFFSIGSKACIKNQAKIGKLEHVVIKKIYRNLPENYFYEGVRPVVSYLDTNNRVWIEDELTNQSEANILVINYKQMQRKKIEQFVINNCLPVKSYK